MLPDPTPLRVAILGLGPVGVRAVERLVALHEQHPDARPLVIHGYDIALPGGREFGEHVPEYLRVDGRLLRDWDAADPGPDPDPAALPPSGQEYDLFPPRREVGAVLNRVWTALCRSLPDGWELVHRPIDPTTIERDPEGGWRLPQGRYDRVLICPSGDPGWDPTLLRAWRSAVPLVDGPLSKAGADAPIPAQGTVLLQGYGHSATDVFLRLTEGRGGRFSPGRRAHRIQYRRSGRDVAVIYPLTVLRSFPEVSPLPQPRRPLLDATLVAPTADALRDAVLSDAAIWLVRTDPVTYPEVDAAHAAVAAVLARLEAGAIFEPDARAALVASLEVALGERTPTPRAALAQSWRGWEWRARALVRQTSLAGAERRAIVEFADVVGPLAAGPATVDAIKLLALIDAGVVDVRSLGTASVSPEGPDVTLPLATQPQRVDAVLDATPAAPGASDGEPIVDALVALGARRAEGGRAFAIEPDGACPGLPGLAVAGRLADALRPCPLASDWYDVLQAWASDVLTSADAAAPASAVAD